MKIVIIGYGWVGQANALALSLRGYDVSFFDPNQPKLHYQRNYSEIYKTIKKLNAPLDVDSADVCYIICVGDRPLEDGKQDISAIKSALSSVLPTKGTVVLRSTVLPQSLSELKFDFYLPEFLHEKEAVEECFKPHFFVVGEKIKDSSWPTFFKEWGKVAHKTFKGTPEEASYIKYLSNIWNAVQIAFVNEFGDAIKEPKTDKDVDDIKRIIDFVMGGGAYVRYGKAFGGHCLPKDIMAFSRWKEESTASKLPLIWGAEVSNKKHEELQEKYKILPEWYSEWQLPEISFVTSLKIITRIFRRKLSGLFSRI